MYNDSLALSYAFIHRFHEVLINKTAILTTFKPPVVRKRPEVCKRPLELFHIL